MYAGRIVEEAAVLDLYRSSRHPYTLDCWFLAPSGCKVRAKIVLHPWPATHHVCCLSGMSLPPALQLRYRDMPEGRPALQKFPLLTGSPARSGKMSKGFPIEHGSSPPCGESDQYFPINAGILQRKVGDVKAVDGVVLIYGVANTGYGRESGCGRPPSVAPFCASITRHPVRSTLMAFLYPQ